MVGSEEQETQVEDLPEGFCQMDFDLLKPQLNTGKMEEDKMRQQHEKQNDTGDALEEPIERSSARQSPVSHKCSSGLVELLLV